MLIECNLESLKKFLDQENISCSIEKGMGEIAIDFLLIDMGEDEKKRPQIIELFVVQKELVEPDDAESQEKSGHATFLHLQYVLPFEFLEETVNDVARFLLLINKTLEFSGFGMSEVDRLVYFRHDLYCEEAKVNTELMNSLLGYILFIIDAFSPTIESLALKELSFNQVVEDALRE